jgi:tetratricopeptide (TPR) repeat protein
LRRALAIEEKSLGPDHPNVANSLNSLAVLLEEGFARYVDSEKLKRRALAIEEKSLGPDHPNVAIRLNNLALLLQTTNRLAEAEPLIRRALAINEKSLGPDHPSVAIQLKNLGGLLRSTNRPTEAYPQHDQQDAGTRGSDDRLPSKLCRVEHVSGCYANFLFVASVILTATVHKALASSNTAVSTRS